MKQCKTCRKSFSDRQSKSKCGHVKLECYACISRRRSKLPSTRLRVYRSSARKRLLDFSLTKEQFISFWGQACFYCGALIQGIGLDRVNNNKGYTIENVVPCCINCNTMKMNAGQEEFISRIKMIASRF